MHQSAPYLVQASLAFSPMGFPMPGQYFPQAHPLQGDGCLTCLSSRIHSSSSYILQVESQYYFVRFSRGAGTEPLPEREVSSQTPYFLIHITNNHHLVSSVQYIIDTKSSKTRFVLLLACSFCRIMLNSKWFKSLLDEHL